MIAKEFPGIAESFQENWEIWIDFKDFSRSKKNPELFQVSRNSRTWGHPVLVRKVYEKDPTNIYLFKVNDVNDVALVVCFYCQIWTYFTPFLVFLLLTLNK